MDSRELSGFGLRNDSSGAVQKGIQDIQAHTQEPRPSMGQMQTDIPLPVQHPTQMPSPDPQSPSHHVHALEHSPIRKG